MTTPTGAVPLKFSVRYDADSMPELFVEGRIVLSEETDRRFGVHMIPSATEHTSLVDLVNMTMHFLDGPPLTVNGGQVGETGW